MAARGLFCWSGAFRRMRTDWTGGGSSLSVSQQIIPLPFAGFPGGIVLLCSQKSLRCEIFKDSRRGPRGAERPLLLLAFQSKHLEEKHRSKCGHFHGAAGERKKNMPCQGPADSIVHAPPLSRYAKHPVITVGTDF